MPRLLLLLGLLSAFAVALRAESAREVHVLFAFDGGDRNGLDLYASEDGLVWRTLATHSYRPRLGEWRIFRDPSVHLDADGVFHLVWTTGESGFGYARSTDAVNWTDERFIVVADPARDLDFRNVWAPELFVEDGLVTIVFSSTLRRDYAPPADPTQWWRATWKHRLYYTSTRDWETFAPVEPFWNPDFTAIDAKIVRRGPADYVLVFKDERHGAKRVMIANAAYALGPYENARHIGPIISEGGIVLRRGPGDYLLYYDRYTKERGYTAIPSADLETFGEPIELTKDAAARTLRHGAIVTVSAEKLAEIEAALAARAPVAP